MRKILSAERPSDITIPSAGGFIMPLLPYTDAPAELLDLFHTEKESILARYYEPEPGLFLAESAKVTLRAAAAGYEIVSMLIEDAQINQEARQLFSRFPDIPIYHAPSAQFLEISGYPMTRGVLSLFRRKYRSRPEAVKAGTGTAASITGLTSSDTRPAAPVTGPGLSDTGPAIPDQKRFESDLVPVTFTQNPVRSDLNSSGSYLPSESLLREQIHLESVHSLRRIAVLEQVGNPANIGSIFRNAAALGVDAILLSKGCCDPLSRRCLRVSMGCVFLVPWSMTGMSGTQIAAYLKEQGFYTAAMALSDHSVSIDSDVLKKAEHLAIFLGNEGNGLPAETISSCDFVVRIPMREGVDSLNVAAASAVAFWELQ